MTSTSMWTMLSTMPYLTLPSISTSSGVLAWWLPHSSHILLQKSRAGPTIASHSPWVHGDQQLCLYSSCCLPKCLHGWAGSRGSWQLQCKVWQASWLLCPIELFQVSSGSLPPHQPHRVPVLWPRTRTLQGWFSVGQGGRVDCNNGQFYTRLCWSWNRQTDANSWRMEGRPAAVDAEQKLRRVREFIRFVLHFDAFIE